LEEQLVRSALAFLAEEPAERLSIRRVAQDVGVSHQAPYVHFAGKRGFLAAVAGAGLQRAVAETTAALAAASRSDARTRLHVFADAYLGFIRAQPHVHDLAYGPLVRKDDHPDLEQAAIEYWQLLQQTVADCQPSGTGDAEVLRRCVAAWGTAYGIARLATLGQLPGGVPGDQRELMHEALDDLYDGWQSPRGTRVTGATGVVPLGTPGCPWHDRAGDHPCPGGAPA
jgi:AcrR family transcriptional regulator